MVVRYNKLSSSMVVRYNKVWIYVRGACSVKKQGRPGQASAAARGRCEVVCGGRHASLFEGEMSFYPKPII